MLKGFSVRALKAITGVVVALGALLALRRVLDHVSGTRGTVRQPARWMPVPGKNALVVHSLTDDSWIEVDLPEGVKKEEIRSAGYTNGEVRIETLHERVDRRAARPRDDSAADRLGF